MSESLTSLPIEMLELMDRIEHDKYVVEESVLDRGLVFRESDFNESTAPRDRVKFFGEAPTAIDWLLDDIKAQDVELTEEDVTRIEDLLERRMKISFGWDLLDFLGEYSLVVGVDFHDCADEYVMGPMTEEDLEFLVHAENDVRFLLGLLKA